MWSNAGTVGAGVAQHGSSVIEARCLILACFYFRQEACATRATYGAGARRTVMIWTDEALTWRNVCFVRCANMWSVGAF